MLCTANVQPLLGVVGDAFSDVVKVVAELAQDVARSGLPLKDQAQVEEAGGARGVPGRERENMATSSHLSRGIYIVQSGKLMVTVFWIPNTVHPQTLWNLNHILFTVLYIELPSKCA